MTDKNYMNSLMLPLDGHAHLFDKKLAKHLTEAPLILDVIREPLETGFLIQIFCPHFVNHKAISAEFSFFDKEKNPLDAQFESFCKGTKITLNSPTPKLILQLKDTRHMLDSSVTQRSHFNNKNSSILITNGETSEQIEQWIDFYVKQHNLEALAIFERVKPNQATLDIDFARIVGKHVVVDAPIGKMEPSAREIYMAADAPGKERMDVPAVDMWRSELQDSMLLEISRLRYVGNARAVLFVSPSDIVSPNKKSVFDRCLENDLGYVQLFGDRCYPWRVRKGTNVSFADHCTTMFGNTSPNKAWCVAPNGSREHDLWNLFRIGKIENDPPYIHKFWRMMGLRHEEPNEPNPTLAPRTALLEDKKLLKAVVRYFEADPVMPPETKKAKKEKASKSGRRLIVTTMKNEGPFLLEWIAYHKAVGFDDFVVFTNDCSDGTDHFFDLLHKKGIVEHRQNPYLELDMKPQHAALADVKKSKLFKKADWVICMDVDEYVNIHVGDGTLDALFKKIGNANMVSMTWRLIGNSDVIEFKDQPIIEQFNHAAHDHTRFPHQAWGVKTLYRQMGFYKKMGVHRPKGLKPEHIASINWVNGSGKELPETFYRTAWRTGTATVGYDMVTLNHYAVRSMESFLVKRDRGRVNHVDRDQGLHYWFRMNHNVIEDNSIKRMIPKMREELDKLMADPEIAEFHHACVEAHRQKIDELLTTEAYQDFYALINSPRLRELSRYTNKFGMNVFELGPDVIPEEALEELRHNRLDYFNVREDGNLFEADKQ